MRLIPIVMILVVSLPGQSAMPAPSFSTKRVTTALPAEVAEGIRESLIRESDVVLDASGQIVATVWFRKEILTRATEEQIRNGLTYREIPETSLIAVVQFPRAFIDFRKQEIPAGVYTLRLAYQPETGDHMGTAPHTEFGLLCPAAADQSLDTMEPTTLYKLSLGSTGGDHPGVMLLFPCRQKIDTSATSSKGDGVWILSRYLNLKTDSVEAKMGFSLTIAGFSKLR